MRALAFALAMAFGAALGAQTLSENFNDVSLLAGAGWTITNNSSPVGTTTWFQGDTTRFNAQAGANNAYAAANYNAGTGTAALSLWLITPPLTLQNGATLTFYTRVQTTPNYADRMQVRLNQNNTVNVGALATDVGDFTTLLQDINPTYQLTGAGSYPNAWTLYTITLSGISGSVTGRIAFRYFVEDGGPSGADSEYIGLDTVTFNPPAPNLSTQRGMTAVADGGTDNVGASFSPGVQTAITYTFTNAGSLALNLTNPASIGAQTNCTVAITAAPASPVAPSSSTTTVLTITPTASGPFSFTYSIGNDDPGPGKNPYDWTVNGTASVFAQPEIALSFDYVAIADGGSVNVGSAYAAGVASPLTFLIDNSGTGSLTLTSPATLGSLVNCAASITAAPSSPLSAGASTGTAVTVTPTAAGAFSFSYSIANNDGNENPFNFTVNGSAGATPAPEIHLTRAAGAIADGGTDSAGSVAFGASLTAAYTIRNQGTAALNLTGVPRVALSALVNVTSASVTLQPAASVAASGLTSFNISFRVTAAGAFSIGLSVASNDGDENPYDWTLTGTGVAEPELDISRAGAISDGGIDALGTQPPSTAVVLSYALANNGNAPLALGVPVSISGAVNCTATVTTQPASSVAAASSTVMVISVTPTGIGAFSVSVSVTNSDSSEAPYNWTISGTGGEPASDEDENGGGCSTGTNSGLWLLALLMLTGIGLRRARD